MKTRLPFPIVIFKPLQEDALKCQLSTYLHAQQKTDSNKPMPKNANFRPTETSSFLLRKNSKPRTKNYELRTNSAYNSPAPLPALPVIPVRSSLFVACLPYGASPDPSSHKPQNLIYDLRDEI